MNKSIPKPRLLSLYPLKAEEALAIFMRANPAKVREGMAKLRRKRGKPPALPTG
jgi:hypothetical protein